MSCEYVNFKCIVESFEGVGDPHFIATSHDHYRTKLCYDVSGDDGDVLLIARNEKNSKNCRYQMNKPLGKEIPHFSFMT